MPSASAGSLLRQQLAVVPRRWPLADLLTALDLTQGQIADLLNEQEVNARAAPQAESSERGDRDGAPYARRDADGDQST